MNSIEDLSCIFLSRKQIDEYRKSMVLLEEAIICTAELIDCVDNTTKKAGNTDMVYDVIIVGAGLSGLKCGHSLINQYGIDKEKILVLEAQDYVGGRVKQNTDFIKGIKIELGAEMLHGKFKVYIILI